MSYHVRPSSYAKIYFTDYSAKNVWTQNLSASSLKPAKLNCDIWESQFILWW